jgi:hypothetical protein
MAICWTSFHHPPSRLVFGQQAGKRLTPPRSALKGPPFVGDAERSRIKVFDFAFESEAKALFDSFPYLSK